MEILTKENLVGAKNCSHCSFQDFHYLTKGNQLSLVRSCKDSGLPPRIRWKIGRRWGWGSNRDLERFLPAFPSCSKEIAVQEKSGNTPKSPRSFSSKHR